MCARWQTGRIAAETGATLAALPLNPLPRRKAPCPFGQGAKIKRPSVTRQEVSGANYRPARNMGCAACPRTTVHHNFPFGS